jgi:hypothetical protein
MSRFEANMIAFYTPIVLMLGGYLLLKIKEEFLDNNCEDPYCFKCKLKRQVDEQKRRFGD